MIDKLTASLISLCLLAGDGVLFGALAALGTTLLYVLVTS